MEFRKQIIKCDKLDREMEIDIYGHYGVAMLMFPALGDSCHEYELNGLMDLLQPSIELGKFQIFLVDGLDIEAFKGKPEEFQKNTEALQNYNDFICDNVVPFIHECAGNVVPIMGCGAYLGAYHAANNYFRRPDLFLGYIAVDGIYDLSHFTGEEFDDSCYFNSPVHFLPNLEEDYLLSMLRSRHHIFMASAGYHDVFTDQSSTMERILKEKDIFSNSFYWGADFPHNYNSWKQMLAFYMNRRV